jgi:hypothetical protein
MTSSLPDRVALECHCSVGKEKKTKSGLVPKFYGNDAAVPTWLLMHSNHGASFFFLLMPSDSARLPVWIRWIVPYRVGRMWMLGHHARVDLYVKKNNA